MDRPAATSEQHQSIRAAFGHARLSVDELWYHYFALGGTAGLVEVDAFLSGLMPLPDTQRDLLAHAVNERLDDLAGERERRTPSCCSSGLRWPGPEPSSRPRHRPTRITSLGDDAA